MKVGDLVKCTSEKTGETKIGIISKVYVHWGRFRVYFGNEDWNEGVWTPSAMELVCTR